MTNISGQIMLDIDKYQNNFLLNQSMDKYLGIMTNIRTFIF